MSDAWNRPKFNTIPSSHETSVISHKNLREFMRTGNCRLSVSLSTVDFLCVLDPRPESREEAFSQREAVFL